MESLPDELNCMIASHLETTSDCANYRLISKQFARLGAGDLFNYFQLGKGSPDSALERMRLIVASPHHLVKNIKGLDYVEEEGFDSELHHAKRHNCRALAQVAHAFSEAGAKLEVLSVQRLRFEFFQIDDEEEAREHTLQHLAAFARSCRHVKDLYLSFDELSMSRLHASTDLVPIERNIQSFLSQLDNLSILTLTFDEDDFAGGGRGHWLDKIVPLSHTWKNLRSLELHHFYVTGYDLISFLRNHRTTGKLKCVHWTYITLKPAPESLSLQEGSSSWTGDSSPKIWQKVFKELGESGIEHGEVFWGCTWNEEGRRNTVEWVVKDEGGNGKEVVIKTDLKMWLEGGRVGWERKKKEKEKEKGVGVGDGNGEEAES